MYPRLDITRACADSMAGPMDSETVARFLRVYRRVFKVMELMATQTLGGRDVCTREAVARCLRERPVRTSPAAVLACMGQRLATLGAREGLARLLRERPVRT